MAGIETDHEERQALLKVDRQEQVLSYIREERDRQDLKWGEQNHHDAIWMLIHLEELGEMATAILREIFPKADSKTRHTDSTKTEGTQAAAVLIGWLEAMEWRTNGK